MGVTFGFESKKHEGLEHWSLQACPRPFLTIAMESQSSSGKLTERP